MHLTGYEQDIADDLIYMIISSKCASIEEIVNDNDEKVIRLNLKESKR